MTEEKKAPISGQPFLVYPQQINPEDEVNLIDIVKTLIKRKKIVLYTLLFFLLAGLIQYFLIIERYNYSTKIRLAQINTIQSEVINGIKIITSNDITPIEDINQIKVRLNNEYIPVVVEKYSKEINLLQVSISINKKSNLITLSTQSEINNKKIASVHQQVLQLLIDSQLPLLKIVKNKLTMEMNKINNRLSLLKDKEKIYKTIAKITLNNQLKEFQNEIMSLQNDLKLATLAEVLITAELEDIALKNKREIVQKKAVIEKLQQQLNDIQATEKIVDTRRSKTPVAIGKKKYLIVSVVIGLFLGLLGVFIAEFVQKIKEKKEEDPEKK